MLTVSKSGLNILIVPEQKDNWENIWIWNVTENTANNFPSKISKNNS